MFIYYHITKLRKRLTVIRNINLMTMHFIAFKYYLIVVLAIMSNLIHTFFYYYNLPIYPVIFLIRLNSTFHPCFLYFSFTISYELRVNSQRMSSGAVFASMPIQYLGDSLYGLPIKLYCAFSSSIRSGWHLSVMILKSSQSKNENMWP